MALFNSLTFDGVNSLNSGIYITGEAVYNAPQRQVEMITVPGRNGTLAIDQGRFENIEVTYPAGCFADNQSDFADKVMRFRNALASRYTYKRLTDEYHPDEYRLGLYKSGLDVDAVRYGTAGEFNIVFDCKPQRFLIDGDRAISPTEWSDLQTESGELVTIDSDGSLAIKSLEVSLEPIQAGSGTPSPTNIRPISGHTEVVTSRASGQLIDTSTNQSGAINASGNEVANATFNRTDFIPIDKARICIKTNLESGYVIRVHGYSASKAWVQQIKAITTDGPNKLVEEGVPSGVAYVRASYPLVGIDNTELWQAETYTTALGRTVYGGTLDVVSGVLTVDRGYIASYNGETLPSTWISDRDEYASGTTPTIGAEVVYELATPQTYQLTPQQIDLLLGTNHLWSDGEITLTYGVHPYYNPTPFESKPLIKVTGKGVLQIGDYVLTIVGRENQTIYIDCDSQEAWEIVGGGKLSRNDYIQNAGEVFPVLNPGVNNIILGTGITNVEIVPRWWRI